jgi:hypothetical protein
MTAPLHDGDLAYIRERTGQFDRSPMLARYRSNEADCDEDETPWRRWQFFGTDLSLAAEDALVVTRVTVVGPGAVDQVPALTVSRPGNCPNCQAQTTYCPVCGGRLD